ncbi:unnamed protein product [Prorocentrum cordatum]|uniref:Uncharacterized protein n=1 Tax=Prorocentrum cordatum TaxID=2364126 RepID=A0ABN9Y8A6_9DINO|nr:unnamed protein product [Polarella glacialis]
MYVALARARFGVEAPPWKVQHKQDIGRFYGDWSRVFPYIFLKGFVRRWQITFKHMWSDPVECRRVQIAEFRLSEHGGDGQWRVLRDAWPDFACRHGIQKSPGQIESMVAVFMCCSTAPNYFASFI